MSCLSLIKSRVHFSAAVSIRTNGFTESLPLTQQTDHGSSRQSEQRGRLCVYFCAIWSSVVTLSVCSRRYRDVSPVYAPGKPQQIQLHSGCSHWLPICLKGNAERTNCFLTPADSSPTATSYHYLTIISGLTVFDLEKRPVFLLILQVFPIYKEPECYFYKGTYCWILKSHAALQPNSVYKNKARKENQISACSQGSEVELDLPWEPLGIHG